MNTRKRYARLDRLEKETGVKIYYPLTKCTHTLSLEKDGVFVDVPSMRRAEAFLRHVKRTGSFLCLLIIFGCAAVAGVNAQCPQMPVGLVCVPQTVIDDASAKLTELKAARDVIATFAKERAATDAEREASQRLIKALNDALDIRGRTIADLEQATKAWERIFALQNQIIERLQKQLAKGKSGFDKVLAAMEKVLYLAAGIAIGGL